MLLLQLALGLILSVSFSLAANENETTTATATTTTATFVTIGSNSKMNSSDTNMETNETNVAPANESITVKPIVHAVNAQARKIEMTKVLSAGDVTASLKSPTNGAANTGSFAISTTMIAIVAALILVVIVSVTVGTAMFVMRRRFSIWRLNNSKQNLNGAGDGGESSSSSAAGEEKSGVESYSTSAAASPGGINVNPDTAGVITTVDEENQLMTVENKGALVTPAASAVVTENETKTESNDAVITENTNAEKEAEPVALTNGDQVQDVSSQSLIVNVLNELSESVANRLDVKSPSTRSIKSNSNGGDNETTTETEATTTTTNEAVTDVPPVSQ